MSRSSQPLRIPYGVADFIKLRRGNEYYVDKTQYLPLLEAAGRFLFLIRPRRFGKSLLQSMMECYYDAEWAQDFDELFADTWIAAHPTPERGHYLTLRFDFSRVDPDSRRLADSFETYCRNEIDFFLRRHSARISVEVADRVRAQPTIPSSLNRLMKELVLLGSLPLYLFVDEYDNFANQILAHEGEQRYRELTHGAGFFRHFFAELKGAVGQTSGGLARLFVTGVLPVTMDDVTSGFNIGTNISLDPRFSSLLGFTHSELERLFEAFGQDFTAHQGLIDQWYNHYHFHKARHEPIVNSDMALYYLQSLVGIGEPPDELVDHNVRIDYGKLRHLVQMDRRLRPSAHRGEDRSVDDQANETNRQQDWRAPSAAANAVERAADNTLARHGLNGNFARLREIIETGEQVGQIQVSFPVEGLTRAENFISLLYYFGLLTFAGEREGRPLLKIPNRAVRQLMYGYLREGYQEAEIFRPATWEIADRLNRMAYRGEWQDFFGYLAEQIRQQASIRDFLQGEKMIQGFLLAWLNLTAYFNVVSEQEQDGGFVDLYLAPFYFRYPDMRHAYLIELKYLKRGDDSPAQRQQALETARAQLRRYAGDARVRETLGEASLHPLVLLYSGWELVHHEELTL